MISTRYRIRGMHCRSCELLIEHHVGRLPEVEGARVSARTGVLEISHQGPGPKPGSVALAVQDAGYALGEPTKPPLVQKNIAVWMELLFAASLVFIFWLFVKLTGLGGFAYRGTSSASLSSALIIGLTAGFSSCMALIGSLVLGISARQAHLNPGAGRRERFLPHVSFNAGRMAGFFVLGGALGVLGGIVRPSVSATGWLIIIAGLFMVVLGLSLTDLFPRMRSGISLPPGIARRLGMGSQSKRGPLAAGALTFFLPCGFTQAMQVAAISSGSFLAGGGIMAAFALGTMPGLLGIGGFASVLRGGWGKFLLKAVGVAVIVLGLWQVSNGWNLTGATLPSVGRQAAIGSQEHKAPEGVVAAVEDGVQVIRMNQWAGGYGPNRFILTKGVPVRWEIDSTDQYSCASTITVPSLKIVRQLKPGTNIIEFTPDKAGTIKFACGMGMFPGSFTVVE